MKAVKNAFLALEKSAINLEKVPESAIILEKGFFTKTSSLGVNYKILRSRRGISLRKRRLIQQLITKGRKINIDLQVGKQTN